MGYMQLMYDLWIGKGYDYLGLTAQNLRDEAAHVERKLSNFSEPISIIVAEDISESHETSDVQLNNDYIHNNENDFETVNDQLQDDTSAEVIVLSVKSETIISQIIEAEGDFTNRRWKTRLKKPPCAADTDLIDNTCNYLINQKQVTKWNDVLKAL